MNSNTNIKHFQRAQRKQHKRLNSMSRPMSRPTMLIIMLLGLGIIVVGGQYTWINTTIGLSGALNSRIQRNTKSIHLRATVKGILDNTIDWKNQTKLFLRSKQKVLNEISKIGKVIHVFEVKVNSTTLKDVQEIKKEGVKSVGEDGVDVAGNIESDGDVIDVVDVADVANVAGTENVKVIDVADVTIDTTNNPTAITTPDPSTTTLPSRTPTPISTPISTVSRPFWENKRLQGTNCSETPLEFYKNDVLMVGDSITRYLYFGLVQRICLHTNCSNLPVNINDGGLARHRCLKHHTVDVTGFRIMYQNHHYGLSPTKVIDKEGGTKDIVYWNSGLWMLSDNLSEPQIINEYDTIIQEARSLCNQNKVKSFFVADNLPIPGGTKGNLDYSYLNALMYKRWESAKLTTNEKNCLKLFKLNWKRTTKWSHIQPDQVHPFISSSVSIAKELWTTLRLGKGTMPCLKKQNINENAYSSLQDYWCKDYPIIIHSTDTSTASVASAASVRVNGQRKSTPSPLVQKDPKIPSGGVWIDPHLGWTFKGSCSLGQLGSCGHCSEPSSIQFPVTKERCALSCLYKENCVAFDYVNGATLGGDRCRITTVKDQPYRKGNGGSDSRQLCLLNNDSIKLWLEREEKSLEYIPSSFKTLGPTRVTQTQAIQESKELGGELQLITQYVEEAISKSMGVSKKGKVKQIKYENFMNNVLQHWGTKGVKCMRRTELIEDMLMTNNNSNNNNNNNNNDEDNDINEGNSNAEGNGDQRTASSEGNTNEEDNTKMMYYAPVIHSQVVLNSYRKNERSWYREVGNRLTLHQNDDDDEDMETSEPVQGLITDMLLEPYDQATPKTEPLPALCIFQDSAVNGLGDLCSSSNKCLQAKTCSRNYGKFKTSPSYDVVYSIAEFWGEGFFHFICENFVRLFVGLDWLKSPGRGMQTKIHVKTTNSFTRQALQAVGISATRLVTGTVHGKAVVIPEPVGCGSPAKMLVQLARMSILSNVLSIESVIKTFSTSLTITVIKRTGSRSVKNHPMLLKRLKEKYENPLMGRKGHEVIEFTKLTMKESVALFSKTDILIGPHGAGLSNALYMYPKRAMLELMVVGKDVNACYMYLAIKLGLKYHTWSDPRATQGGSMTVDVSKFESIVDSLIEEMEE